MQSFKKITIVSSLFMLPLALINANAQFYDLDDQGLVKPTGNYKSKESFVETQEAVTFETSGDEGGFIPEANPDELPKNKVTRSRLNNFDELPVANGFDAFSTQLVSEEKVAEQIRDIKQLDSIGFLDPNFDEALWLGVSYDHAQARFSNFKNVKSIHIKKVLKSMLMAKARVPKTDKSWLLLRLKTLIQMGNLSDARLLLKELKPKELLLLRNVELNTQYLQANMLEPTIAGFIKQLLEQNSSNIDYKKAFLINLYNAGKTSQAALSFKALVDADDSMKQSNFAKIFGSVLNNEVLNVSDLGEFDIYEQYLIALNSGMFGDVDYSTFADQTLMVALSKASNLSSKTMYAELLMQNYPYSYNLNYLTSVYDEHKFTSKDLSAPLTFTQKSNDDYANRALFYQASKVNSLNSTKALSLKKLWASYDSAKLTNIKQLITETTQNIAVNSSIAWFSMDLLKNELKQAKIDNKTIQTLYDNIDNSYMNSNILNLQIAVEFLRKTSLVTGDFDSIQDYKDTLQTWFNAQTIKTSAQYNYVLKVLTLLDALEAPIKEQIWADLYEYSHLERKAETNPVWLRLVTSAMSKDEKGKALLLVAEKFVKHNEQSLDPQTLANVIATLNYLNMPQEMALVGVNAIVK